MVQLFAFLNIYAKRGIRFTIRALMVIPESLWNRQLTIQSHDTDTVTDPDLLFSSANLTRLIGK
jgi:hypothetical protein